MLNPRDLPDLPIALITGQNREAKVLTPKTFQFIYNKGKEKVVGGGRNSKSIKRNTRGSKLADSVSYGHFKFIDY